MAILGLHPDDQTEYTLRRDTGDNPTVFLINFLDARVWTRLMSGMASLGGETAVDLASTEWVEVLMETLGRGIGGWRNFKVRKGNEVTDALIERDDEGKLTDRCLTQIPTADRMELFSAVISAQRATEDDEGKS